MNLTMKIFKYLVFTLILTFIFSGCAKSKHKIGSMYKGGYVFKINIFGHGLVAAPTDFPKPMQWGCYGTLINGANGDQIGTGQQNTKDILAGCSYDGDFAAKSCSELNINGYNDWYLPSVQELQLMQRELYAQSLGGLKGVDYWSSTQDYSLGAWKVNFATGEKANNSNKEDKGIMVRAIRSF